MNCRGRILAAPAGPALHRPSVATAAPIRRVVASVAGGHADVVARILAVKLEGAFGRRILVGNKAAVSGMRAPDTVAGAAGDGETLLLGAVSQLVMSLGCSTRRGLASRHAPG